MISHSVCLRLPDHRSSRFPWNWSWFISESETWVNDSVFSAERLTHTHTHTDEELRLLYQTQCFHRAHALLITSSMMCLWTKALWSRWPVGKYGKYSEARRWYEPKSNRKTSKHITEIRCNEGRMLELKRKNLYSICTLSFFFTSSRTH